MPSRAEVELFIDTNIVDNNIVVPGRTLGKNHRLVEKKLLDYIDQEIAAIGTGSANIDDLLGDTTDEFLALAKIGGKLGNNVVDITTILSGSTDLLGMGLQAGDDGKPILPFEVIDSHLNDFLGGTGVSGKRGVELVGSKWFVDVSDLGGGGDALPSQTGNSGKFLTTNGTDPSWGTITGFLNLTGGALTGPVSSNQTDFDPEDLITLEGVQTLLEGFSPEVSALTKSRYEIGGNADPKPVGAILDEYYNRFQHGVSPGLPAWVVIASTQEGDGSDQAYVYAKVGYLTSLNAFDTDEVGTGLVPDTQYYLSTSSAGYLTTDPASGIQILKTGDSEQEITVRIRDVRVASSTQLGLLSAADWTTFNSKPSTSYVTSAISTAVNDLLNGAGPAYNTLKELQDLIIGDETAITGLTTAVGNRLVIANNLSDLANAATARTNLGLSTVATTGAYSDLSGKPTNVSFFTNDAGFLTGITGSQVTTALGFTPYNATNPSGYISSASSTKKTVSQTAHGFSVGNWLKKTGANYALAQADAATNADVYGVVESVTDANNFVLNTGGDLTTLTGLTANTTYYLSPSSAGTITTTEPSTAGQVSKPVLLTYSTTGGFFFNMRGVVIQDYADPYSGIDNNEVVYRNSGGLLDGNANFTFDGTNLKVGAAGNGIILKSPDGTNYKVTVANGGTLTTTAV